MTEKEEEKYPYRIIIPRDYEEWVKDRERVLEFDYIKLSYAKSAIFPHLAQPDFYDCL